jgi:hypothetical protein
MKMEGGKVSLQDMFQALMVNEGRGDEYKTLHEQFIELDGRWGAESRTRWDVMREMGYEKGDAKSLRRRYNELCGGDGGKQQEEVVQAQVAAYDLEKTLAEMTDLPPVASPALELEWVRGHPAMMRRDLQVQIGNKVLPVLITPEDILAAPHGLPPSRSAVYRLVNWANRPDKWNEQLLGVDKKAEFVGMDATTKDEAEDMTLQEVRELLKQFANREVALE